MAAATDASYLYTVYSSAISRAELVFPSANEKLIDVFRGQGTQKAALSLGVTPNPAPLMVQVFFNSHPEFCELYLYHINNRKIDLRDKIVNQVFPAIFMPNDTIETICSQLRQALVFLFQTYGDNFVCGNCGCGSARVHKFASAGVWNSLMKEIALYLHFGICIQCAESLE